MYYIKKIKLSNIRGFKNLVIDLGLNGNKPRLNTLIVGKNGTGKTTLLRCITIGLLDVADSNALVAENTGQLVSEKEPAAEIRIELESIETNSKKIELITEIKKYGVSPHFKTRLLNDLVRSYEEYGAVPKAKELTSFGLVSWGTYKKFFGSFTSRGS